MSKAPKASKKVTHTIPAVNTAWTSLVAKTQKMDTDATSAVITFAKVIASRKVDIRNARKSVEELGTKSPILLTSQIEALPVFLALNDKTKGYEAFQALTIKEKLTKSTAAYKLGADIATQFPTYEALSAEIKAFNKRKNSGKSATPKETKPAKAKASVEDMLNAAIALVESLSDDVDESIVDLVIELNKATALRIGIDA
jgi:flagellar biosynthesis/type III secretory pathway protein FliH